MLNTSDFLEYVMVSTLQPVLPNTKEQKSQFKSTLACNRECTICNLVEYNLPRKVHVTVQRVTHR